VVIPPLSDADFEIAMALARVRKKYGSIAKFFECEERTRIEKDQARRKWQMEQLAAV